jgi:hypothetical protein
MYGKNLFKGFKSNGAEGRRRNIQIGLARLTLNWPRQDSQDHNTGIFSWRVLQFISFHVLKYISPSRYSPAHLHRDFKIHQKLQSGVRKQPADIKGSVLVIILFFAGMNG